MREYGELTGLEQNERRQNKNTFIISSKADKTPPNRATHHLFCKNACPVYKNKCFMVNMVSHYECMDCKASLCCFHLPIH